MQMQSYTWPSKSCCASLAFLIMATCTINIMSMCILFYRASYNKEQQRW